MKKCIVLSENTYSPTTTIRTLYRNIGAMEVVKRFRAQGVKTTHLEWVGSWKHSDLESTIETYFSNSTQQYIAISVTFSLENVINLRPVLDNLRVKFPNVKIIVGGNRNHDNRLNDFIDYVFLGRSMEMLDAWIQDEDMHQFATDNPQVLINQNIKFDYDVPVIPEICDEDLLNSKDILGFEIGIGCKFNCSFCGYPLRGTKDPLLVESERIREFLQGAYDRYGVHNFYIADDTLNEQDVKLEILANAVEALTYEPNIVCYFRIDLLDSRPQQVELLKRCKLKGLNLGIETLTPAAAKTVRKTGKVGKIVNALKQVKEHSPQSYVGTGMIIGLTGDTKEQLYNNINYLKDEKLVHAISPYNLTIETSKSGVYEQSYLSEFAKNPERFGYTIERDLEDELRDSRPNHTTTLAWVNDWTNHEEAYDITQDILENLRNESFPITTAFEWIILLAMNAVKDVSESKLAGNGHVWSAMEARIGKHKNLYIANKIAQIQEEVQ